MARLLLLFDGQKLDSLKAMNGREMIYTAVRQPRVLLPYSRILLLSHMRANTSLFGHLLAENPAIEGYYELHIGYHSWRSLLRQKLIYASSEKLKPGARYFFDKVLHNDHGVKIELFAGAKLVFMLRSPQRTVPSIISLYAKREPDHEYATPEGAADYYEQRLAMLAKLFDRAPGAVCYMDADSLRLDAENTLTALSKYLELEVPLSPEYSQRAMTGRPKGGDSSNHIAAGRVLARFDDYKDVPALSDSRMAELHSLYEQVRQRFLTNAKVHTSILCPEHASQ